MINFMDRNISFVGILTLISFFVIWDIILKKRNSSEEKIKFWARIEGYLLVLGGCFFSILFDILFWGS